jgi:hypothetical protein
MPAIPIAAIATAADVKVFMGPPQIEPNGMSKVNTGGFRCPYHDAARHQR